VLRTAKAWSPALHLLAASQVEVLLQLNVIVCRPGRSLGIEEGFLGPATANPNLRRKVSQARVGIPFCFARQKQVSKKNAEMNFNLQGTKQTMFVQCLE